MENVTETCNSVCYGQKDLTGRTHLQTLNTHATDTHLFHTLPQIQPFLISHALTCAHTHSIVFQAVLPEYALTFILSAVTSLLPHQIVRKFKHTGMHIHTQREDTE